MKRVHKIMVFAALVSAVGLTGCRVGSDFRSPEVVVPERYRYMPGSGDTLVNLRWWRIFRDTTLQCLIMTALEQNKDAAVAASRLEQARLNLRATRANLFPSLAYQATAEYGTDGGSVKLPKATQAYSVKPSVSWEIDFFGKLSRATEAARDQMLASEQGYRAVLVSLVGEVASAYFSLLEYDRNLEVSRETYDTRRESLRLVQASFDYGAVSELDLSQAKQLVASASAAIPQYERAIAQTEHALSILLGRNPGPVLRGGASLLEQYVPVDIPVGIPSDLLHRRPDVLQAYYDLAAQTQQIGIAEALRLPSVSITGQGGTLGDEVRHLFKSGSWVWGVSGGITGPIFNFGRLKANADLQREKTREALLNYEQTVLTALGDVENALVAIRTYRAQTQASWAFLQNARLAARLSQERYQRGMTDYLEVLDSERSVYQAELDYASVWQARLDSFVQLYKALGGGWLFPGQAEGTSLSSR